MRALRSQQTIRHVCHVSGRGYWTGSPVTLAFLPAPSSTGIVFRRVDLPGNPEVLAIASNRRETPLRTRLVNGFAEVEMVEHVMATLFALQIDNCIVQTNAREMPGLDGSAWAYTHALRQAGLVQQSAVRSTVPVDHSTQVEFGNQTILASPIDRQELRLEYQLDYGPGSTIGASAFSMTLTPEAFVQNIAPARTFITQLEANALQSRGLATHVTFRDLIVFGEDGPINNSLRFPNECARHKMLDLIGDLALAGHDIHGQISACRSGHILNGRMAERLGSRSCSDQELMKVA